jgi:hypothetical protein
MAGFSINAEHRITTLNQVERHATAEPPQADDSELELSVSPGHLACPYLTDIVLSAHIVLLPATTVTGRPGVLQSRYE